MSMLRISLLGSFQVTLDEKPVTIFESDKVRALLAYLAVEAAQPHRREILAALFWPNMPEVAARGNLRHALVNLRRAIHDYDANPPYILINRHDIQFNQDSQHELDTTTLMNATNDTISVQQQAEKVSLYRGDFLAGLSIADSNVFEEWATVKREQYHRLILNSLCELAEAYAPHGDYEQALSYAQRRVELEPWNESAHQQLIRLLALAGQQGAALMQYENCRRILETELGVAPTAVTTTLYENIRDEIWPDETARLPLPLFLNDEAVDPAPLLFVARQLELRYLADLLNQACQGQGSVAFVVGEAGGGKTALLHAFSQQAMVANAKLLIASGKCGAYTGSGDPYQPFLEIIQMLTGDVETRWEAGDISVDHARCLWSVLPEVAEALVGNGNLLLDRFVSSESLLKRTQIRTRGQALADAPWLAQLAKWVQAGEMVAPLSQNVLFDQFSGLLKKLSRRQPLVLLLDDLQWIDNGSLNLLFHLGQKIQGHKILILGAYRPGDVARSVDGKQHPLIGVSHELQQLFGHDPIDLSQTEKRPFIDAFIDSEPNRLDENFRQVLYNQTGGQALFTTELLRGLQERGDLIKDDTGCWVQSDPFDWDILPTRIEAVIAGRINRLPEKYRTTLTIASVEGEAFTAEVVAHIQKAGEHETVHCLSGDLSRQYRLVTAQSRQLIGQQHVSRYRFHHILFQKYLYNTLDVVERARLHEAIGDTLEKLYGEREAALSTMFGQLAWHYQEAGVLEKAIAYYQKAGDRAWQLSAATEAISHLKQGLAMLEKFPDSPERKQRELNLQMSLVMPLQAAKGFAAPEFRNTCDRAYLLSQQVGETPQLIVILSALGSYYLTSGQYRVGLKLAQKKLALAQRFQDDLQSALARLGLAANYTLLGEFVQSRDQTNQLLDFYDFRQHHVLSTDHSIDPGVNGLIWAALVSWIQGFPVQAAQYRQEAIDLARVLEHALSLTAALEVSGAILHILSRDYLAAGKDLEESLQLASDHKFGLFQVEGMFYQGFLMVTEGDTENGITQMQQSLDSWKATGMRIMYSMMLGLLGESLGQVGQVEAGLRTLDEAFAVVNNKDEYFFATELHRIKGDLLRQKGGETAVIESAYQQAIHIARRQAARSWELRVTLALARVWQAQGNGAQARLALTELYDWFTEGFDTPDLKDARTLLDELANSLDTSISPTSPPSTSIG